MKRGVLAMLLAACGSTPSATRGTVPWSSSGIDWMHAPAAGEQAAHVPRINSDVLPNGLRVIYVANPRLPLVEISTVHATAGSRHDGLHPGRAALVVDLLREGGGIRTPAGLVDELDRSGARLEFDIATDYATSHLTMLSDRDASAVDLAFELVTAPSFTQPDLDRVRALRRAELLAHQERARTVAAQAFDRAMFGTHPYAQSAEGTPEGLDRVTLGDLREAWAAGFTPESTTLILAGDLEGQPATRALAQFATWQRAPQPRIAAPPLSVPTPKLYYVDRPGADQTAVVIGRVVPSETNLAADVANTILGGQTDARLARKLRDDMRVTAGVSSSFWRGQWAATWGMTASIKTAETGRAVRAALAEIDRLRKHEPTDAELARAKALLGRGVAQAWETSTGMTRALQLAVVLPLPDAYYETYADQLALVSAGDVRAAADELWSELSIVVVGDWSAIRDDLRSVGLPIEKL